VSGTAIALILAAAIAHASWNLFSKQAAESGAAFFIWLFALAAAVAYAPVVAATAIVSRPHLTAANWAFLAGTGALHTGYFLFLQFGYRHGELSVAYPIGRGSGALLAAVAGIVLLGERPGAIAIIGIAAIITGVVVIGFPSASAATNRAAVAFALTTGAFIGCYTLWDKYAVAVLRTPPVFQGYAGIAVLTVTFAPVVLRDRRRIAQVWRDFSRQVIGAAILAPLAYMLILVALSFTAVSVVAPAREVSVLFGILLGRRMLGEGSTARRLAAGAAIVSGIIIVAVG
jgi:drug/metabolite transporter (DMT)-like permease